MVERMLRTMRSTTLALATAGLLALAGSGGAATAAEAATASTSTNWAGYAVSRSGVKYRRVTGTWVQPAADCSQPSKTYSAYWVGLGGLSSSSKALEQIGTEADCSSSGQATYSAWYELVPSAAVDLTGFTVRPGDRITATVDVQGNKVRLRLNNVTRKKVFDKTVTAGTVDTTSAEWIVEAPALCDDRLQVCQTQPLANFSTVKFSSARAISTGGHTGGVQDPAWSATAITLAPGAQRGFGARRADVQGGGGATPGALSPSGAAFTVGYAATTPAATA
jgi:hypothetical protein